MNQMIRHWRFMSETYSYPERQGVWYSDFTFGLSARTSPEKDYAVGQPIPVAITYSFALGKPKPPPGTSILLWAGVWFEDLETRAVVESYTFDVALVVGGREEATGALTWDAPVRRPGRFRLR